MNANVVVEPVSLRATSVDDGAAFMDGCDLLVLCADEPQPHIQLWTNEAALRIGTPWMECGYFAPQALVVYLIATRSVRRARQVRARLANNTANEG
jgi:hypothetical protein